MLLSPKSKLDALRRRVGGTDVEDGERARDLWFAEQSEQRGVADDVIRERLEQRGWV